jgi:hypothetical protein
MGSTLITIGLTGRGVSRSSGTCKTRPSLLARYSDSRSPNQLQPQTSHAAMIAALKVLEFSVMVFLYAISYQLQVFQAGPDRPAMALIQNLQW